MGSPASSPVAMTARIALKVDDAKTKQEMQRAGTTIKQQLSGIEDKMAGQVNKSIAEKTQRISAGIKDSADKLNAVLSIGLKAGLGAGGASIAAFLRSSTADALRFKSRLAEVETALGGVGQKLATQVKFGGKNLYEWAEKLTDYLNNLSTDQLQKAADIIKTIAITVAGLKTLSLGADLLGSAANAAILRRELGGGAAGGAASAAGAGVVSRLFGTGAATAAGAAVGTRGAVRELSSRALQTEAQLSQIAATSEAHFARIDKMMPGFLIPPPGYTGVLAGPGAGQIAKINKMMPGALPPPPVPTGAAAGAGGAAVGATGAAGGGAVGGVGSLALGGVAVALIVTEVMRRTYGRDSVAGSKFKIPLPTYGEIGKGFLNMDPIGFYGGLYQGPEETAFGGVSNARQEAAQRATMRRFMKGDIYQRNIDAATGASAMQERFASTEAQSVSPLRLDTMQSLIPEFTKARDAAASSAAEFEALRDKFKVGDAAYANYEGFRLEAANRALTMQRQLTAIEKMKVAEDDSFLDELDAEMEGTMRRQDAVKEIRANYKEAASSATTSYWERDEGFEKQRTALKDALANVGGPGFGSLSLGAGVAQMPQLAAQRLQGAENDSKQLEIERNGILTQLKELAEIQGLADDEREKNKERMRKARDKNIEKITGALTGEQTGSPAP